MNTNKKETSNYEETFYIIPRYIRKIPGMKLSILDVYETIFQFWNKGRECFLSNSAICERTGFELRVVQYALTFLEKNKLLERIFINGKRYLVQPVNKIETDCNDSEGVHKRAGGGAQTCTGGVHDCAPINKEVINKENKKLCVYKEDRTNEEITAIEPTHNTQITAAKTTTPNATPISTDKEQDDREHRTLFATKFAGYKITYGELLAKCRNYYTQNGQQLTLQKWKAWILNEKITNYEKLDAPKKPNDQHINMLVNKYQEYVSTRKAMIQLKLVTDDKKILSFEEWREQEGDVNPYHQK